MMHEFDSSMTCNYCGVAAERTTPGGNCPARKDTDQPAPVPSDRPAIPAPTQEDRLDLAAVYAVCTAATPGPWAWDTYGPIDDDNRGHVDHLARTPVADDDEGEVILSCYTPGSDLVSKTEIGWVYGDEPLPADAAEARIFEERLQLQRQRDRYREGFDRLRAAIITHRAQKADDRCIEDDDRLYEVLGDGIKCDRRVGSKIEMLINCQRFIERRCEGGGWPSYAELEAESARLTALVARLQSSAVAWRYCRDGEPAEANTIGFCAAYTEDDGQFVEEGWWNGHYWEVSERRCNQEIPGVYAWAPLPAAPERPSP